MRTSSNCHPKRNESPSITPPGPTNGFNQQISRATPHYSPWGGRIPTGHPWVESPNISSLIFLRWSSGFRISNRAELRQVKNLPITPRTQERVVPNGTFGGTPSRNRPLYSVPLIAQRSRLAVPNQERLALADSCFISMQKPRLITGAFLCLGLGPPEKLAFIWRSFQGGHLSPTRPICVI